MISLESEISEVPISAHADFFVNEKGITEILVYRYFDPKRTYEKIAEDRFRKIFELEKIKENLQYYLDLDEILINQEKKRMKVKSVSINFQNNEMECPSLIFTINVKCSVKKGINFIEFLMMEEIAEYPFTISWHFPSNSEIVEVESVLDFKIEKNKIHMQASQGSKVGGYERIVFKLS